MSRFVLLNCMGALIIADKRDSGSVALFFEDGSFGSVARAEYSRADKIAVVDMMNAREAPPRFIPFRCENVIDDYGNPCGDEGRACESCQADAMAAHAYLRGKARHSVFNDQQAIEERNQELRDGGRGHLVSL